MIYFSFIDFLKASIAFFALGNAFAFLRSFIGIFPEVFGYIIRCIFYAICGKRTALQKAQNDCIPEKRHEKHGTNAIFDFSFTLLFGISFIIFSYVFLDGCIRIFSLALLIFGYFIFINHTNKLSNLTASIFIKFSFLVSKILCFFLFVPHCLIKFVFFTVLLLFRRFFHPLIALKKRIFVASAIDNEAKKC